MSAEEMAIARAEAAALNLGRELMKRLPENMSEIVSGKEGRVLRYLRPIRIMPSCLNCHGPTGALDPEVAALIAERYPDDASYITGEVLEVDGGLHVPKTLFDPGGAEGAPGA